MNISRKVKFGIAGAVAGFATSFVFADDIMQEQRAEEMKALIHDVLDDADDRASFLGDGGSVSVNVHGFVQTGWTHDSNDGDATQGFSINRTRLIVSGDAYGWDYKVSGQWDDGDSFTLKDAYADWNGFRVGQFKTPFMTEVLGSQTDTLAAERSVVSSQFGQGRSQGVQYGYRTRLGGVRVAYTDGFDTANGAGVQNGYALTGRLDARVRDWLGVGVAVSHNDLDTTDYNTWTADATFSWYGIDFTGAYVATLDDTNGDDWGTVWTVAYQCTDEIQGFVQYENGVLDGVDTDLSIATVGVNYALNDNVKWTTDLGYSYNGIDAGWGLGSSGWSTTSNEGETLLRTQLQVTF